MPTNLTQYTFTLRLTDPDLSAEQLEAALVKAGCDDATLSGRKGQWFLTFTRPADSLPNAVASTVCAIAQAGLGVCGPWVVDWSVDCVSKCNNPSECRETQTGAASTCLKIPGNPTSIRKGDIVAAAGCGLLLILVIAAILGYVLFVAEPRDISYGEWLAYVDDAWELKIGERIVYLGVRERFWRGIRWYMWEPTDQGRCAVVPADKAQRLLILFGDPGKSLIKIPPRKDPATP